MDLLGPSPIVGIDIGKRTLKIAAIRAGRPPHLVHAAICPTPDGAFDGGTVRNPAVAAAALRAALRAAGIRRGRAVVGIGRTAVVRTLMLPPMPPEELKNAVKWEAERHLPLRIDEAVLDAQVVREVTEDGQRRSEVLMAAVPERDAALYYQAVHDAGLDVEALEVSSLALARSLQNPDIPTAAVDIGADGTDIVITQRGSPPVCRSLPVGADHLAVAGSTAALGDDAGGTTAAPGWQDLLDGLSRSIDYFQAQARRERVQRVVVTGEGACASGVVQMVAAELRVPVTVGNPLTAVTAPRGVEAQIGDRRAALAVALGLALRPS